MPEDLAKTKEKKRKVKGKDLMLENQRSGTQKMKSCFVMRKQRK